MIRLGCVLVGLSLALAACGETKEDRGVTGAGLGAAAGAILGAVTGLSVLQGALIGTAVGGAAGLLTDKEDLDIGDPVWKKKDGSSGSSSSGQTASAGGGDKPLVSNIQSALSSKGYDVGPADGVAGPKTRDAIRKYQQDHSLLVDGQPSPQLLEHSRQ